MTTGKFDHRLQSVPNDIWQKIAQIEQLKGQWISGAKLSPQVLGRLKKSVLVTSTGSSTRIEGSKLTDEDVEKLMRGINMQKFRDRDTQEVQGYYELLETVFESWRRMKLSESAIKSFHKELLKYASKDKQHRGDYKKKENKVHMVDEHNVSKGILFDTTDAFLTPKEMQELTEWTVDSLQKNQFHPLLVIANFILEFLTIHPFEDGNGRLSRIVTNLLLMQSDYEYMPYVSHEKLIEDNKSEYYVSLRKSQNTLRKKKSEQTIVPWLEFFFDVLLTQSNMAIALLSTENLEKLLTEKQLAVWIYLQEAGRSTPREIAQETNVAYSTVRQALSKLLRLKKIERLGEGRSTSYQVV
jgi:Fic family protein